MLPVRAGDPSSGHVARHPRGPRVSRRVSAPGTPGRIATAAGRGPPGPSCHRTATHHGAVTHHRTGGLHRRVRFRRSGTPRRSGRVLRGRTCPASGQARTSSWVRPWVRGRARSPARRAGRRSHRPRARRPTHGPAVRCAVTRRSGGRRQARERALGPGPTARGRPRRRGGRSSDGGCSHALRRTPGCSTARAPWSSAGRSRSGARRPRTPLVRRAARRCSRPTPSAPARDQRVTDRRPRGRRSGRVRPARAGVTTADAARTWLRAHLWGVRERSDCSVAHLWGVRERSDCSVAHLWGVRHWWGVG